MPLMEFEPTITASERPQTYALDRTVTGTDPLLCVMASNTKSDLIKFATNKFEDLIQRYFHKIQRYLHKIDYIFTKSTIFSQNSTIFSQNSTIFSQNFIIKSFYVTRTFITAVTSARHQSLSLIPLYNNVQLGNDNL
jgi:hypothetical protein